MTNKSLFTNESNNVISDNIRENMTEGVLVIGLEGVIKFANKAFHKILGLDESEVIGKYFASLFFNDPRNDDFSQTVLDSIYNKNTVHQAIVPYYRNDEVLHLRLAASFLTENGEPVGISIVISDLTELTDLRDAVKSMEKIRALNEQLEIRNKLITETFGRFLSDDIVKRLLDTPDGLNPGGMKQNLTIMMSDLRGFTSMSERMDASDLISMLNHYLGEMTEIIQGHNGTIVEFIGDGIFAIFGAPEKTETHAADAVAAALEMEERMHEINGWNEERHYPVLEMGIGINTGEVILGNIGSEKRMKYGVVGSHVNICGRIESYTVGGQVLISASTKGLIDSVLEIEQTMTVYPKGATEGMELYHVTGIGTPYDIHIKTEHRIPEPLEHPIPVSFFGIDGKHTDSTAMHGKITAASSESATLTTEVELELYDNVQIEAGGKLFCKIVEKGEDGYMLRYTSVPDGYETWLNESVNGL